MTTAPQCRPAQSLSLSAHSSPRPPHDPAVLAPVPLAANMHQGLPASSCDLPRRDLASNDAVSLEGALRDLGAEYAGQGRKQDLGRPPKLLWIQTIQEAIKNNNIGLCSLLLKKLNIDELQDILIDSSTDRALEVMANYFQINDERSSQHKRPTSHSSPAESCGLDPAESISELSHFRLAMDHETEENFVEALSCYEASGCKHAHVVRVTMKHLLCASQEVLQKYCSGDAKLHNFWLGYLIECNRTGDLANFSASIRTKLPSLTTNGANQRIAQQVLESLPNQMQKFIKSNPSKWTNKSQLELITSMGSAGAEVCRLLAELASHSLRHGHIARALEACLGLDLADCVIDQYLTQFHHPMSLESVCRITSSHHGRSQLHNYIVQHIGSANQSISDHETFLSACVSLGLLDELMCCMQQVTNHNALSNAVEQFADVVESGDTTKLTHLDPLIVKATLKSTLSFLKEHGEQDLNVYAIVILILAIDIFLIKLEAREGYPPSSMILKLECMFDYLARFLNDLTFNAPDSLIRATNNLITAIKNKLEMLADSEIIKESFKKLVETVAGRCLIESRYKSAALLYSQVEDNVNAIKSLMRTGETDTVMNYALLVRDITVNRLTINYIKHLKVEPKTIEDFIIRSTL